MFDVGQIIQIKEPVFHPAIFQAIVEILIVKAPAMHELMVTADRQPILLPKHNLAKTPLLPKVQLPIDEGYVTRDKKAAPYSVNIFLQIIAKNITVQFQDYVTLCDRYPDVLSESFVPGLSSAAGY